MKPGAKLRVFVISFLSSFVFLFGTTSVASVPNCQELFTQKNGAWASVDFDWKSLDRAPIPVVSVATIPMDQLRLFASDQGSLHLILKTSYRHDHQGLGLLIRNIYFRVFENESFNFAHLSLLFDRVEVNEGVLAKAKRGDFASKKLIASALLTMQVVLRQVLKDPQLNLLTAKGMLKVYGLTEAKNFPAEVASTLKSYKERVPFLIKPDVLRNAAKEIAFEVVNSVYHAGISDDGIMKVVRAEHFSSQVHELIEKLHLPPDRQKFYLDVYDKYLDTKWPVHGSRQDIVWSGVLEKLNFFIHAYVEKFPKEKETPPERRMSSRWFLSALFTTERLDHVYQINEQRLSQNLDTALALNNQVDSVMEEVALALQTQSRLPYGDEKMAKELNDLQQEVSSLKVSDLTTEDLTGRIEALKMSQFHLSQVVEKILKNVDLQNIQTFLELNFSWSRILADKSYAIVGRDYDHVVFGKDVLNYFKHEQLLGDRSLAALSKGYVGRQGESGVRFITEIHKDLRYVKLMKGRKVRLIGRLRNRTITFFAIYDRDEAFDQIWLRNLIESH